MENLNYGITFEMIFLIYLVSISFIPCFMLLNKTKLHFGFHIFFLLSSFYIFTIIFDIARLTVLFKFGTICFKFNAFVFLGVFLLFIILFCILVFFYGEESNESLALFYCLAFFSLCAVSARDFISVYFLIESINLCIFILIYKSNNNIRSLSSSLNYLIVNLLTSSVFLFGVTCLYMQWGSFNFDVISLLQRYNSIDQQLYVFDIVGCLCIIFSFVVKMGGFPFHNWFLDVYQGLYKQSLLIISCFTKVVFFLVFFNICNAFQYTNDYFSFILLVSGIGSILLGSLSIIFESKVRLFLGLFSLISTGFGFLIIYAMPSKAIFVFLLYLISQSINLAFFIIFIGLSNNKSNDVIDSFDEQVSLYNVNVFTAFLYFVIILSIIGIPPLMGFLPKLFFLYYLTANSYIFLIFIIILYSFLTAIAFLRIIFFVFSSKNNYILTKSLFLYNVFGFLFLLLQLFYCYLLYVFININVFDLVLLFQFCI